VKTGVLNFCANNYLGLSSHPKTLKRHTGTLMTGLWHELRAVYLRNAGYSQRAGRKAGDLSRHRRHHPVCGGFDANGGVFEPLFNEQDAIISDALNHASIIDGVRLCKAQRYRYEHNNMDDLEAKLKESAHLRSRIIVTDGVFSMDGTIAQLDKICDLADKYDAIVMVDECHASGFVGKTGRGTHEYRGCMGRIDIITGTLGKALGGASGGFTSGAKRSLKCFASAAVLIFSPTPWRLLLPVLPLPCWIC
jgi:glycine C-acetyltransferase